MLASYAVTSSPRHLIRMLKPRVLSQTACCHPLTWRAISTRPYAAEDKAAANGRAVQVDPINPR